jgi:phage terminase large subunit
MSAPIIKMPPKHWAVLNASKKYLGLFGGRGAGKSQAAAGKVIMDSFTGPGAFLCCRQFMNSNRDSSKGLLEKLIREHGLEEAFAITNSTIINRQSGRRILFVGLERNVNSIRSIPDICGAWLEEAQDVSAAALEVLWPTIREAGAVVIATWNPMRPDDPIDEFFRKHPRPDMASALVNHGDNPWFDDTSLRVEMDALRAKNRERARHVWDGLYDTDHDSKVFPDGSWRIGAPRGSKIGSIHYGADLGAKRDPTAGVKVAFYSDTKELYVVQEVYGHGVPIEFVPELFDKLVPTATP